MDNDSTDQDQNSNPNSGQIKIIHTPAGEAPLEIREAWVGLILPCHPILGYSEGDIGAVSRDPTERNRRVICVPQQEAISILALFHPNAAQWWCHHGYPAPGGYFSFGEYEVEIIFGVEHQQIREWTHHDDLYSEETRR